MPASFDIKKSQLILAVILFAQKLDFSVVPYWSNNIKLKIQSKKQAHFQIILIFRFILLICV